MTTYILIAIVSLLLVGLLPHFLLVTFFKNAAHKQQHQVLAADKPSDGQGREL